jgi:hypothetical protein
MSVLTVQCGVLEPTELSPGDRLELHRRFVTGSDSDTTVSRKGNAALLFDRDGDWFVHNQSTSKTLTLVNLDEDRAYTIQRGSAQKLTASYSELHVGGRHKVGLTVHTVNPAPEAPGTGEPTQPPLDQGMEERLLELFQRRPQVRIVMLVRYQDFIPGGRDQPVLPKHLTAQEVTLCYSSVSITMVNQYQRDIRDLIGLTADNLGPWMVERGLLRPTDRIRVPHDNCPHRPR